jgi:hypothetical protein
MTKSLNKLLILSPCRKKVHRERGLLCAPLFHTTGHTVCANQLSGENKPDIQLRKYQSSDISISHLISFHTHTIISFMSDLLLYFHLFICLPNECFQFRLPILRQQDRCITPSVPRHVNVPWPPILSTSSLLSRVSTYYSFVPMPPHVPYGLRGLRSRLRPKCNRLLSLGRP